MRWIQLAVVVMLWPLLAAQAGSGTVLKVLPHYLDQQGRHTLSPSLYERDAYQAHLRKHPEMISTLRFDVNWRARGADGLKLRVEVRGRKTTETLVLEQPVKPGKILSAWTELALTKEQYQQTGEIVAWRVTLLAGSEQLAEYKSFLW